MISILVWSALALLAWVLAVYGIFWLLFRRGSHRRMRRVAAIIAFVISIVLIAGVVYGVARNHLPVQVFAIGGNAMLPAYSESDLVLVNALTAGISRGDVVIYTVPQESPPRFRLGRIVGLPSERFEIKEGDVYIDGSALDESAYWGDERVTYGETSVLLSANDFFVLGDNRDTALDSRSQGPVPREHIVGAVFYHYAL